MPVWDNLLTEQDKKVFTKAGYGKEMPVGSNPALLIIDMTYEFLGLKPEPVLKAIETFPTACGQVGWDAVHRLAPLLEVSREQNIPVIYTVCEKKHETGVADPWSVKKRTPATKLAPEIIARGKEIVDQLKPEPEELVIAKHAPSAFFGTPLIYYLNRWRVDTLLITGCTTSGCVRSTVTDAFSYGFSLIVLEDCVFDRGESSHKINLFDMQAKFANLKHSHEVIDYVKNLATN